MSLHISPRFPTRGIITKIRTSQSYSVCNHHVHVKCLRSHPSRTSKKTSYSTFLTSWLRCGKSRMMAKSIPSQWCGIFPKSALRGDTWSSTHHLFGQAWLTCPPSGGFRKAGDHWSWGGQKTQPCHVFTVTSTEITKWLEVSLPHCCWTTGIEYQSWSNWLHSHVPEWVLDSASERRPERRDPFPELCTVIKSIFCITIQYCTPSIVARWIARTRTLRTPFCIPDYRHLFTHPTYGATTYCWLIESIHPLPRRLYRSSSFRKLCITILSHIFLLQDTLR